MSQEFPEKILSIYEERVQKWPRLILGRHTGSVCRGIQKQNPMIGPSSMQGLR